MSDKDSRATLLEPGPVCLAIVPLLPVLDEEGLDASEIANARTHLATCAYCQAQRALYVQLDRVLVRHFAPNAEPLVPITVTANLSTWHDDPPAIELDDLPVFAPPPQVTQRRRGYAFGLASLAAVLVLSLMAGVLFATHQRPQVAGPSSTPVVIPGTDIHLEHVSMVSADEGWAIGTSLPSNSDADKAIVMHYTGGKWVSVKTGLSSGLTGIKMISATDGWIIGVAGIAHYDGHSWQRVETPGNGGLNAMAVVSPTDIWVVGGFLYKTPKQATILHYDGTHWTLVATPQVPDDYFELTSISMLSADDGWAVGVSQVDGNKGTFPRKGVILHYASGSWHIAQILPDAYLWGIGMASPVDGWIMGNGEKQKNSELVGEGTLWWHYLDGKWISASLPTSVDPPPQSISVLADSEPYKQLWAIGSMLRYEGNPGDMPYVTASMVLRYANGTWAKLPDLPVIKGQRASGIREISFVAPDEFWAVGWTVWWDGQPVASGNATQSTVTPLILHYKDGIWTVALS